MKHIVLINQFNKKQLVFVWKHESTSMHSSRIRTARLLIRLSSGGGAASIRGVEGASFQRGCILLGGTSFWDGDVHTSSRGCILPVRARIPSGCTLVPADRQTPVKTLPFSQLRLRKVNMETWIKCYSVIRTSQRSIEVSLQVLTTYTS